jgi:hypothetical protein
MALLVTPNGPCFFGGMSQAPGEGGMPRYGNLFWRYTPASTQYLPTVELVDKVRNGPDAQFHVGLAAVVRAYARYPLEVTMTAARAGMRAADRALRRLTRSTPLLPPLAVMERAAVAEAAGWVVARAQLVQAQAMNLAQAAANHGFVPVADSESEEGEGDEP